MEERISKPEDTNLEMILVEKERELRSKRNEEILRDLSSTFRKGNITLMGILEGGEREKGIESLFKEIIAENLPNLGNELHLQVNEVKRKPIKKPQCKKTFSKTHYMKTAKSQQQRKNFKGSHRKKGW